MNILIKEYIDNDCTTCIVDLKKLNRSKFFENDFYNLITSTIKTKSKQYRWDYDNKQFPNIIERFSYYSDGAGNFEKLKVNIPCNVDHEIEIFYE